MMESGTIVPSWPGTETSSETRFSKPGYETSVLKMLFAKVSFVRIEIVEGRRDGP